MTKEKNPIVEILVPLLTAPLSPFYVPKLLQSCKSPSLEPYSIGEIDLGSIAISDKKSYNIRLKDIKIKGISNIQIEREKEKDAKGKYPPRVYDDGSQFTFYAQRPNTEAPMPGVSTNLVLDADFILSSKGKALAPGHIHVEITHAQLTAIFDATSTADQKDSVRITFKKLALLEMLDQEKNIVVKVEMDFFLIATINAILNQEPAQKTLIQALNDQLGSNAVLDALSTAVTAAAIGVLKK